MQTTTPPAAAPIGERRTFYYGWVMLGVAAAMTVTSSVGQTFGVQAFNPSIAAALSLSKDELSGAYMLATFLAALPMSLIGAWADRFGPRRTMLAVAVPLGAACWVMSAVAGPTTLTVGFFMLRLLAQGSLTLLAGLTLARWFRRRLGLANGLAGLCMAGAVAGVPALFDGLIERHGWRDAYAILGVAVWAILLPVGLFVFRGKPEDIGQVLDGAAHDDAGPDRSLDPARDFTLPAAARTPAFWVALAVRANWAMICTAVQFHQKIYFTEAGYSASQSDAAFFAYGGCWAVTQTLAGYLADKVSPRPLLVAGALLLFAGVAAFWAMVHVEPQTRLGSALPYLFGGLCGAAQGFVLASDAVVWPRFFGLTHLGKIRGAVWTVTVVGTSVGPFVVGGLYALTGGYGASMVVFLVVTAGVCAATPWLSPPRGAPGPGPVTTDAV